MLPFRPLEIIIVGVVLIGLVSIFVWANNCSNEYYKKVKEDAAKCEAAGGVYLDRTYSYGKNSTGHLYTCVWKDLIIKEY